MLRLVGARKWAGSDIICPQCGTNLRSTLLHWPPSWRWSREEASPRVLALEGFRVVVRSHRRRRDRLRRPRNEQLRAAAGRRHERTGIRAPAVVLRRTRDRGGIVASRIASLTLRGGAGARAVQARREDRASARAARAPRRHDRSRLQATSISAAVDLRCDARPCYSGQDRNPPSKRGGRGRSRGRLGTVARLSDQIVECIGRDRCRISR